jgi:hypothetical protein
MEMVVVEEVPDLSLGLVVEVDKQQMYLEHLVTEEALQQAKAVVMQILLEEVLEVEEQMGMERLLDTFMEYLNLFQSQEDPVVEVVEVIKVVNQMMGQGVVEVVGVQ